MLLKLLRDALCFSFALSNELLSLFFELAFLQVSGDVGTRKHLSRFVKSSYRLESNVVPQDGREYRDQKGLPAEFVIHPLWLFQQSAR